MKDQATKRMEDAGGKELEEIIRLKDLNDELVETLKEITNRYERLEVLYAKNMDISYDCKNGSIKRAKQAIAEAERDKQ